MKSNEYKYNDTKQQASLPTPTTNNYDNKNNNKTLIKTPSPTNVIINLNSEFCRAVSISKENDKASTTRIKFEEEEQLSKTSCSGNDIESVSSETSLFTSSLYIEDDIDATMKSHDDTLIKNTTTPNEKYRTSTFENESTTTSASINHDYNILSSPGTKFVSELSEYIELEDGQYGVLAGIMDRQWCNIITTTNDEGTKNSGR